MQIRLVRLVRLARMVISLFNSSENQYAVAVTVGKIFVVLVRPLLTQNRVAKWPN